MNNTRGKSHSTTTSLVGAAPASHRKPGLDLDFSRPLAQCFLLSQSQMDSRQSKTRLGVRHGVKSCVIRMELHFFQK